MKRQYSKPNMSVEMFEANEYIANCVKVKCKKPHTLGVFYENNNKIPGYQEFSTDNALYACEKNQKYGPCGNEVVIKETLLETRDNLYYDSDGAGIFGTVTKAYYFTDNEGYKHYFRDWVSTGTSAS